jgi:type II secretory pathway predicted ATPase ExeA
MSYPKYWSLRKLPFGRPQAADDFYPGRPQREALARLDYVIQGGHEAALLIAPAGTGQTSLLQRAAASAGFGDVAVEAAYCLAQGRDRRELLRHLAERLGCQRLGGDGYRAVLDRIVASGRSRVRTVWLVDECNHAAAELASALSAESPWFTAVLGCRPTNALAMVAELGGCPLRIDLPPFELGDTCGYIKHQLVASGGRESIFTDGAMVRLHELSEGYVATLAKLAELTLPVGAAQKASQINVDMVEAVQHEVVYAAA